MHGFIDDSCAVLYNGNNILLQALSENNFEDGRWYTALAEVMQNVECARAVVALLKRKPSLLSNFIAIEPLLFAVDALKEKVCSFQPYLRTRSFPS